uniref:Pectin acetylesterase n=2 Tax=Daucus carota subsp. sativus TaxID=79200 RepID=A0A165ZVE0_DAUCS
MLSISTHRRIWRRKLNWVAAAAAVVAIFLLGFSLFSASPNKTTQLTQLSEMVPLTLISNAKKTGAFCLDGSLPGYHFQKGFGSGTRNWLLHIEGGGWCNTIASCSYRKTTALGSSKYMDLEVKFGGILSSDPSENPDFFSWNKVKIRYCDGASFAGRPESEINKGAKLFFRGQLIWEAVKDELLSLGLSNARQALLSGCSAGGLATLIHCDDFRDVLPKNAKVKCLSDAGFFLNEKDIAGNHTIQSFYHDVVQLQGVSKSLNKDCVAKKDPFKCLFPQEFTSSIKTPIFLVNPAYDFWQIQNILVPVSSDFHGDWSTCKRNIHNCSPNQVAILQGFRNSLLKALTNFLQINGGVFINSCYIHCQTWIAETWHGPASPKINNKTIAESVGEWYFNDKTVQQIDCPYPCNPTCYNMVFP